MSPISAGRMHMWSHPHEQRQPRSHLLILTKSQLFDFFSNEDSRARCWGESLLAQRGRESTQLTFFPNLCPRSNAPPSQQLKRNLFQIVPPFLFLSFSLSVLWNPSYPLCFFFLNNPMFTSGQLVACSAS